MPDQPFTISALTVPEGTCFTDFQTMLDLVAQYLAIFWNQQYSLFNFGPTVPSTDDQLQPWIRTNNDGSLDRIYVFNNGNWLSPHAIPSNFVTGWNVSDGDAAGVDLLDGGNSNPVTISDGPFWAILAIANGRFLIGAGTPTGSGVSTFPSKSVGGEESVALTFSQLPAMTGAIAGATTGAAGSSPGVISVPAPLGPPGAIHNNTPNYYCLYWIVRTARLYYLAS